jgi:hypothetical protein
VFPLQTKEERLRYEQAIISSLYNCADFTASKNWLGNYVPETQHTHVKSARMWLSKELHAEPLTDQELAHLSCICQKTFFPCADSTTGCHQGI